MGEQEKGCVYFFRHTGLKPIKIGYSSHQSPISRFEQFKTYAPFGAEIIGFIQTSEAKKIETLLHLKYASKRINGEWFLISEDECLYEIDFYSNEKQDVVKTDLEIKYAKKILFLDFKEKEQEKKILELEKQERDLLSRVTGLKQEEEEILNIIIDKEKNLNTKKYDFEDFKKFFIKNKNINKKEAAKVFGVSRVTIYNWINKIKN